MGCARFRLPSSSVWSGGSGIAGSADRTDGEGPGEGTVRDRLVTISNDRYRPAGRWPQRRPGAVSGLPYGMVIVSESCRLYSL